MNDHKPVTEAELKARAVAPRVTLEVLEDHISSTHYFTAAQGVYGADGGKDYPPGDSVPLGLLTFCVIVLKNGFTVVGKSACASPENYNKDIGERIALENAKNEIWPLLGYALRDHLAYGGQSYWTTPAKSQKDWLDGDERRNGVGQ